MNDVISAITTVGFPIVAAMVCFYAFIKALKYLYDKERQSLLDTIDKIGALTLAVEKNSEALRELVAEIREREVNS